MKGIRAWNCEKGEFLIRDSFSHLLSAVKLMGSILVDEYDLYMAERCGSELSEVLAVKSVRGTSKEYDNYEILFRERLINRFYDLENPIALGGLKTYFIDKEKLQGLEIAARNN
ncbi:MAG: hypothetical protein Q8936_11705 [Bacillota bacterium]|nr:hypothetical protein [Bacillota bacterium]